MSTDTYQYLNEGILLTHILLFHFTQFLTVMITKVCNDERYNRNLLFCYSETSL